MRKQLIKIKKDVMLKKEHQTKMHMHGTMAFNAMKKVGAFNSVHVIGYSSETVEQIIKARFRMCMSFEDIAEFEDIKVEDIKMIEKAVLEHCDSLLSKEKKLSTV